VDEFMGSQEVVGVNEPVPQTPVIKASSKKGKISALQQQQMNLVKQLTDGVAVLTVKLAVCDCKDRMDCKVFTEAQGLAHIIDKLQEVSKTVQREDKSRTGVRT
jgi:hypothetical protein